MINAAANIEQAAAAARADVERALQKVDRLTLLVGSKEVLQYALQHLLI